MQIRVCFGKSASITSTDNSVLYVVLFVLAVTTILWLPLGKSFSPLGEISIQKAKVPEESKEQPSGSNDSTNPNSVKFDHADPMSGAFEKLDTLGASPEKKENDIKDSNENDFENKGSPMDLDGQVKEPESSNTSIQNSADSESGISKDDLKNPENSSTSDNKSDSNPIKQNLFALTGGEVHQEEVDDENESEDDIDEETSDKSNNESSKLDEMLQALTRLREKNPNEIIDLDLKDLNLLNMLKPWERLFHKKKCLIKMSIDNAITVLEDHKKDDHDLLAKLVTFNRNSKWKFNPNSQDSIE